MNEPIPNEGQPENPAYEVLISPGPDVAQEPGQAEPVLFVEPELPTVVEDNPSSQTETAAEPAVVEPVETGVPASQTVLEASGVRDVEPPAQPQPNPVAEPTKKPAATYTRGEVIGFGLALSLVTLILAVVLSLGFLAVVNGGLSFPSSARFNDLSRQADTIQRDASALRQDVSGLQSRVDALQAVSGRVDTVEKDTQALRTSLDASAKQVDELQGQVTGLSQNIDGLKSKAQVFDGFLQGLRNLLNNNTSPTQP